jgi:hypothetical protein
MKNLFLLLILFLFTCNQTFSQDEHNNALEGLYIEAYYLSDSNDAGDEDGGSLPEGFFTYRIYADLHPGYFLTTVYGDQQHELFLSTTTLFFNNEDRGEETGDKIRANNLGDNTVALDSWVTIGAASDSHLGIPKKLDTDGSIIGGPNNDGGSEGIEEGLLANNDERIAIPLTTSDGMVEAAIDELTIIGADLSVLGDVNAGPELRVDGGAWAILNDDRGVKGPTEENMVLIAQITTDGVLTGKLNIQLSISDSIRQVRCSNPAIFDRACPIDVVQFVHTYDEKDENPTEFSYLYESDELSFTVDPQFVTIKEYESNISIFPNPASERINIEITGLSTDRSAYVITDITGKKVLQGMVENKTGKVITSINISELEKGIYFFSVPMSTGSYVRKFIKN